MPNKYSHALVYSHYESRGLLSLDQSPNSKPVALNSFTSNARSVEFAALSAWSDHESHSINSSPRLRLESSPYRSQPKTSPSYLHRNSSSVDTQIYAPRRSPSSPPLRQQRSSFDGQPLAFRPRRQSSSSAVPSPRLSTETRLFAPLHTPSPTLMPNWRHSSIETQSCAPQTPPSNDAEPGCRDRLSKGGGNHGAQHPYFALHKPDLHGNSWTETLGFAPQRPPSPPATPNSGKSFSFNTQEIEPQLENSPPPIPERSAVGVHQPTLF